MDAIQHILRDHRELERLFRELERTERSGDGGRRAEAARTLVRELSVHAAVEEQHVYPAIRAAGADDRVLDALEEHHAAKVTLAELQATPVEHPRFGAKLRVLAESVRRHVTEEERELLPLLERALDDDRRRALGDALERARRAAPTRPHPAAPDTPPGNFVVGALAAIYDRSRDALRGAVEMIRTVLAQGAYRWLETARSLAATAPRRVRAAVEGAAEQGRAALEAGAQRGREAVDDARQAAARLEVRGAEAASTAARRGRGAARRTRRRARGERARP
jgi:hemerythrin superfamily protein